jgi:hypothetical protein
MRWLLLMAPLLMAAAPPPADCGHDYAVNERLPIPLDRSTGLAPSGSLLAPAAEATVACANVGPKRPWIDPTHDEQSDALHGLPLPDLMQVTPAPPLSRQPMGEP